MFYLAEFDSRWSLLLWSLNKLGFIKVLGILWIFIPILQMMGDQEFIPWGQLLSEVIGPDLPFQTISTREEAFFVLQFI